jgi:hypothetical protein
MKVAYIDKNGNAHLIEHIEYLEDDDEIVKMLIAGKSVALHKASIFERTYSVVI